MDRVKTKLSGGGELPENTARRQLPGYTELCPPGDRPPEVQGMAKITSRLLNEGPSQQCCCQKGLSWAEAEVTGLRVAAVETARGGSGNGAAWLTEPPTAGPSLGRVGQPGCAVCLAGGE